MNYKTPELVRLRALRTYYFNKIAKLIGLDVTIDKTNLTPEDAELLNKYNEKIKALNEQIATITNQPIEQIVTQSQRKRGRPKKN